MNVVPLQEQRFNRKRYTETEICTWSLCLSVTGQPLLNGQTFRAERDGGVGTMLALCLRDHQVSSKT